MKRPPKLCHQKKRDYAYITWNGEQVYLGKWGSIEAQENYERYIREWSRSKGVSAPIAEQKYLLSEITVKYIEEYRARPVHNRSDLNTFIAIAERLSELFPRRLADDFTIRDLEEFRQSYLDRGFVRNGKRVEYCRTYVNKLVNRLRTIFSWAAAKEMVSEYTYSRLGRLRALAKGRTTAPEPKERRVISEYDIEAVTSYLNDTYQDIVKILLLTGLRPSEICNMRVGDIDRCRKTWVYRLDSHKTAHKGKHRVTAFGKRAQIYLIRHLEGRSAEEFVFTPKRIMEEKWDLDRQNRKTKMTPYQLKRSEDRKDRAEHYNDRLNPETIGKAIARACREAIKNNEIEMAWTPYDLRHTAITSIRLAFGAESAQHFAGHSNLDTQAIYDHSAESTVISIAMSIG